MMFFTKKQDDRNRYKRKKTIPRTPIYTMHAKSEARRSEAMHKVGAIFLLVAALGGLAWVLMAGTGQIKNWLFTHNDRFLIEDIEITSTGTLSAGHIREFGGISEGKNLFEVDINVIRKKLEDGPLIKSAQVQRQLPSTLSIRVNERNPLARIAHGQAGFFFAVDQEGHVLGLAGRKMAAMPVINGISDRGITPGSIVRDGGAMDALQVIAMCDGSPLGQVIRIATIDVGHPDYLDMVLDSGLKVRLPRNPPRGKLEDLVAILRDYPSHGSFLDLTIDRNVPAT